MATKNDVQTYLLRAKDVTNTGFNVINAIPLPLCEPGINRCGDPNCYESKLFKDYSSEYGKQSVAEKIFVDKVENFSKQLAQLRIGKHPDLLRHIQLINQEFQERIIKRNIWKEIAIKNAEIEYEIEKNMIEEEYESQKEEVKESLLLELEEKKKALANERTIMYYNNGDCMDTRYMVMRKLRRRPHELPSPVPERKKKNDVPAEIRYRIDANEAENDLKLIDDAVRKQLAKRKTTASSSGNTWATMPTTRRAAAAAAASTSENDSVNPTTECALGKVIGSSSKSNSSVVSRNSSPHRRNSNSEVPRSHSSGRSHSKYRHHHHHHHDSDSKHESSRSSSHHHHSGKHDDDASHKEKFNAKVENGKLKYEKRWFLRGQRVDVEGKKLPKYCGIISSIKSGLIWVNREDNSGSRLKVRISQLAKGKVTIKRRAS